MSMLYGVMMHKAINTNGRALSAFLTHVMVTPYDSAASAWNLTLCTASSTELCRFVCICHPLAHGLFLRFMAGDHVPVIGY